MDDGRASSCNPTPDMSLHLPLCLAQSVLDKLQVQGQDVDISALASQLAGSRLNGQCTLEFKSGCTYEGAVRDSALEGPGKIVFKDGLSYEGTFECNALQGNGVSAQSTAASQFCAQAARTQPHSPRCQTPSPSTQHPCNRTWQGIATAQRTCLIVQLSQCR